MERDFFLVVPLGAEENALSELLEVSSFLVSLEGKSLANPISRYNMVKGGIEFKADLAVGLQLNYWLKIPVRILMRLFQFKSRDRGDFKKPIEKAPWQEWLHSTPTQIKVESTASNVWNESWVVGEVEKILDGKLPKNRTGSIIYFRGLENQWTVSIDLSGEPLFKRGWATLKEKAPIRENLAYLGLRQLVGDDVWNLPSVTLADPFLGSGTILAEGFHFFDLALEREFSFEKEPFCPKLMRDKKVVSNYRLNAPKSFGKYFGTEIDPKTAHTAIQNLKNLENIEVIEGSFADEKPESPVWILTNPPYEKRVRLKGQAADWVQTLIEKWHPDRLTFFFPKDRMKEISWPKQYNVARKQTISNGGIQVQLMTLIRT